jgi:tetratricopeptide (TPR) repeat protein
LNKDPNRAARVIAVVVLLFAAGLIVQAQTATGDINLERLGKAVSAISENRLSQAEALLNSVLAALPNDADALNLLGVVRAKQDRSAEAERLFKRALARSPSHVGAHINLGELLLTSNRPAEAMTVLLRAHKLAPNRPEINLSLARLFIEKKSYQEALGFLRLVPSEALNDETKAEFALLLSKGGFNEDALGILGEAETPTSFPILYALGVVKAAQKQFAQAEEHLNAALALKPDDVATLRALARVARLSGNLEKALAHLVKARRLAPNSPAVLYDFGITTFEMDLFLDALPVFEQLHRDHPREPAYLYALAAVRWRKGEHGGTARLMNSYIALQPNDPAGFYLLGAALLQQDLFAKARAALERSLSLKSDPQTEYLLGVALEKLGQRAAAIETFQRVIRRLPNHAAALSALGSAYREAGNYKEARAALERAVELDPNDLRANYQLGLVHAKLGDQEAAKRLFARADDLRAQQRNQESVVLKLTDPPQE